MVATVVATGVAGAFRVLMRRRRDSLASQLVVHAALNTTALSVTWFGS